MSISRDTKRKDKRNKGQSSVDSLRCVIDKIQSIAESIPSEDELTLAFCCETINELATIDNQWDSEKWSDIADLAYYALRCKPEFINAIFAVAEQWLHDSTNDGDADLATKDSEFLALLRSFKNELTVFHDKYRQ